MSQAGKLVQKLLLVKFNVSYDTGYRSSKEMVDTLSKHTDAQAHCIRSGFSLFCKTTMSPFTTAISRARQHYQMGTLPWEERGWRVIPVNKWQDFKDEMDDLISDIKDEFIDVFDKKYHHLEDVFNENVGNLNIDFPSKEELEDKFWVDIDIGQMASCDDIRIQGIDQAERNKIRSDMQKQYSEKFNTGLNELATKLVTAVEDISSRASDPDQKGKKYTKSLSNITELADTVEGLNVTGNDAIAKSCKQIRENISVYSADSIKSTPLVRDNVIKATANIKDELANLEIV